VSRNMRPEVRRWGPSAGLCVGADTALDLLAAVSKAEPEIEIGFLDEPSRDVYRVVWKDGAAVLDRFAELDERVMSFAIAEAEESRGKAIEPPEDALAFFRSLRACAESWRECLDPDDGSLELLIDV